MKRMMALVVMSGLLISGQALAEPHIYMYDQFGPSIQQAANEVNGQALSTQPGFVQGEAFGQIYRPNPNHYPIQINGIDLILAAPPNASGLTTHAQIEIWNSTAAGPDPGTGTPFFQISTTELFNQDTGVDGVPLQGNVGLSVDFDLDDPDGHPNVITSGNIWVMIRMTSAAQSMEEEWGTLACAVILSFGCGCQNVGTINDFSTTNQANVLNIVTPVGQCSGNTTWMYNEEAGVTGDYIIRMRADVAAAACVPDCEGAVCGDDGCGGSCGTCGSNEICNEGTCQPFCLPDCVEKACGDDSCGGTCGSCNSDETCVDGTCAGPGECVPACPSDQTCENGVCVAPCVPACDDKTCGDDSCGGSCGSCGSGETCENGACVDPTACAPACDNGQTCENGLCVDNGCPPSCDGKDCGDDGCGGSCGVCSDGQSCSADQLCVGGTTEGLSILDISPDSGDNASLVSVAITGTGFVDGLEVIIAGEELTEVKVTGATLIRGKVPAGLPEGPQTVTVANPDGTTATLTDGYTVLQGAAGRCGDAVCDIAGGESTATCPTDCGVVQSTTSGCAANNHDGPLTALAALLALGAMLLMRRRERYRQGQRRS